MRRIPLVEAVMQGWARLDAAQRERFFEAFVAAALRPGGQPALRAWLRRRLQYPPLAEPFGPAAFAISDADIALLLGAGEATAGPRGVAGEHQPSEK